MSSRSCLNRELHKLPNSLKKLEYRRIIDRIKLERSRLRLTQNELAKRLGKPQSFIAKIEGYERRLDILEFIELADALGVKPAKLLK